MADSYTTPYTAASSTTPQGTIQQQDQIIRQQDQSLDQLSRSVATLGRIGGQIHDELISQTVLIDDLDRGVDQTKDALVSQQTRLKRLLKNSKDNWKFFCVIVLVVIVLGVILYLIFTGN